jgi:hypothetical protein
LRWPDLGTTNSTRTNVVPPARWGCRPAEAITRADWLLAASPSRKAGACRSPFRKMSGAAASGPACSCCLVRTPGASAALQRLGQGNEVRQPPDRARRPAQAVIPEAGAGATAGGGEAGHPRAPPRRLAETSIPARISETYVPHWADIASARVAAWARRAREILSSLAEDLEASRSACNRVPGPPKTLTFSKR